MSSPNQLAVLMGALTVAGMLVTGVSGYYVQRAQTDQRIAEVRVQYVSKEDSARVRAEDRQQLSDIVQEHTRIRQLLEDVRREQAVQSTRLDTILRLLERQSRRSGGAVP